jgi:hypothetical protein
MPFGPEPVSIPTRTFVPMVKAFTAMPSSEKFLLLAAWLLLGCAAIALRIVPFRKLAPLLGKPIGAVGFIPLIQTDKTETANRIRRAIIRSARIAPLRSDCLPQAFAAAIMCRWLSVPASIHLGVKREGDKRSLAAHAWVCSGPVAVTGGRSFGQYTPVACFLVQAKP